MQVCGDLFKSYDRWIFSEYVQRGAICVYEVGHRQESISVRDGSKVSFFFQLLYVFQKTSAGNVSKVRIIVVIGYTILISGLNEMFENLMFG